MQRVASIEGSLPAHPKNIKGKALPYRSERFRQVEEMIGICRKLLIELNTE